MKAKKLNTARIDAAAKEYTNVESLAQEKKFYGKPFLYAAVCEHKMELNLREDYKRKYTFTSDLSIAEWYVSVEGLNAVTDTIKRASREWIADYKAFCELIISVNLKSWEHHANKHPQWAQYYAEMYYVLLDFFWDTYGKDNDAVQYYYDYVD